MPEKIPDKYQPLKEIQTNHRFSTFEGLLENKKVFIKFAVDPELKERLSIEANGLRSMRQLDPNEMLYHVPSVIELTDDYIVTEWAEGAPMADDFAQKNLVNVEYDLSYLVRLYSFIDQTVDTRVKMGDIIERAVDKHITNLKTLEYEKYVDKKLIDRLVEYIRANTESIETRTTNGDLQPGNIMVAKNTKPTIIDCETYRDSWPRHYNIVNFVFNYGAEYPELLDKFRNMLDEYGQVINVNPSDDVVSFNFSAAMRSLQIIEERLSGDNFNSEIKDYVETSVLNILGGRLFTN